MTSRIGRDKDILSLQIVTEFSADASRIFSIIGDVAQWPGDLDRRILKRQPSTRVIGALIDFSRPEFTIDTTETGCKVTLLHDLIKTEEDLKAYKKLWKAWFKTLLKRVSQ